MLGSDVQSSRLPFLRHFENVICRVYATPNVASHQTESPQSFSIFCPVESLRILSFGGILPRDMLDASTFLMAVVGLIIGQSSRRKKLDSPELHLEQVGSNGTGKIKNKRSPRASPPPGSSPGAPQSGLSLSGHMCWIDLSQGFQVLQ